MEYRSDTLRLQSWNYANSGYYFVTICIQNKEKLLSEIIESNDISDTVIIKLTAIGKIAQDEWLKTKELRKEQNVELGEYILMPNHLHGIIIINNSSDASGRFGLQEKNLSSIIRGFKSAVTSKARKINPSFKWQIGYYEHIIRNDNALQKISNYIKNNPYKWKDDDYYI